MYSPRNEALGRTYHLSSCESEQRKNVIALGFATGQSLNLAERHPVGSNHDENYYRLQQMLNGQYIKMRVNGASTICSLASTVIHQ